MIDRIEFGWGKRLPVMVQAESSECGLTALAMISSYFGHRLTAAEIRARFPVSLKGMSLTNLCKVASNIGLATRAVRLELDDLPKLRTPCLLHWNFNHFVVLKSARDGTLLLHDPASGVRRVGPGEAARAFTGVAVEFWPANDFAQKESAPRVRLRKLVGPMSGLKRSLGYVLLLAACLELLSLLSPMYMQWVIDNAIVAADLDLLTTLALGFGLLVLVQQFVGFMRAWAVTYFSAVVRLQWQSNVFTHLVRLPVQYFEKRHLGDVVSRFGSTDAIQKTLTSAFLESILDGIMAILVVGMMFLYSVELTAIVIGSAVVYGLLRWIWFRPLRNAAEEQILSSAKQQSHFLETVRGIRALKLFSRQDDRRSTWLSHLTDQTNADLHTDRLGLFYRASNGLVFGLENVFIVWLGARAVIGGDLTLGALTAFIAYKMQFGSRVTNLIDKYVDIRMLRLQAERLSDIVLTPTERLDGAHGTDCAAEHAMRDTSIEVRDLWFRYSEFEPWVLKGISFKVKAGESVAVVGPSGCGKSTLVSVLLGILPAVSGEVRVGGVDVERAGVGFLRDAIGTVMQDDALFAGSIADNISFFAADADQSWIEECARRACVHADIMHMPMGYNSMIGDMGTVLSGGQKQRVLLARALYKRPKILVLDEATSHLDAICEAAVNTEVRSMKVTRLLIAHRAETIASADRVVVIVDGKTVDQHDSEHGVGANEPLTV